MYHKDTSFSLSHESHLRLPATIADVVVGVEAAADLLALVPLPPVLWHRICKEGGKERCLG